jgi:hypothetical protein
MSSFAGSSQTEILYSKVLFSVYVEYLYDFARYWHWLIREINPTLLYLEYLCNFAVRY